MISLTGKRSLTAETDVSNINRQRTCDDSLRVEGELRSSGERAALMSENAYEISSTRRRCVACVRKKTRAAYSFLDCLPDFWICGERE